MRKKINLEETQHEYHQVSEPVVSYGLQTIVNTLKQQPSSKERITASTMSVDEYYNKKVLKRDMTPEELYTVIVDDVKAIYADETI
jgi:hypothetical protein